ncbi:SrfA family protein [Pasteurella multocida]|uniref:SrfA family protein n=1 Tax=Pasteurella multocida TaxID=747 RepID=UPI0020238922|nr:SrfA family protein [Pasteurella multocida]URH79625.1 SrfA family protein [Pasteurella multocida]HDR1040631.1 virulence factor [Pasteurella multocida]HDR1141470.1 virulence factor [Pasteurella multocida]HDR1143616.1 virulence factor [Pasteurella multocida]HDR1146126.1 virulence factor [Pasteurella multocida]
MLSALLRSGDVKNYTALGQDGTPVYAVASQLRDAIKFRVKDANDKTIGKRFANYLAIPQRNDQGSQIDWYVPFESDRADGKYMIIPWTSATDEERAAAFAELSQFEQAMLQFGLSLKKSDNLQGDLLLFSRLLCGNQHPEDIHDPENLKALRFPNPDYVYLVNNRPVITFWGFLEKNTEAYGHPFLRLKPVVREPAAPVISPEPANVVEKKPWWRWLLWLLPFLLLGLLALFFLRSCGTTNVDLAKKTTPVEKTSLSATERLICLDGRLYRFTQNKWVSQDNGQTVTEKALITRLTKTTTANLEKCDRTFVAEPGTKVVEKVGKVTGDVAHTELKSVATTDSSLADKTMQPNLTENGNTADKTLDPLKANKPTSHSDRNSPTAKEDPVAHPTKDLTATQNPAQDQTLTNKPLQIPAESSKTGNVDFLNGKWNAGAGIQDKTTGKPLRLNYEFEKGKGKVRVERGDGVQCVGDVNAAMRGGSLSIANTGIANCSDGSFYQLPSVNCKPDVAGSADCEGEYGSGQRFPMSMKTP